MVKNDRGFSVIEVLMAVMLTAIVAWATVGLVADAYKKSIRLSSYDAKDTSWRSLSKTAYVSLTTIKWQFFNPQTSFSLANSVPVKMTATSVPSPIVTLDVNDLKNGEPETFITQLIKDYAPTSIPVYVDSFTVERRRNLEAKTGAGDKFMSQSVAGFFASRCVPIHKDHFDSSGATVSGMSPGSSAVYVLGVLDRRPFLVGNGAGQMVVRCCPYNVGPSCDDGGIDKWVPRVFFVSLDANQRVQAVSESPTSGETETVYGSGFMLTFNHVSQPTYYNAQLFQIYSRCHYSRVAEAGCMEIRPAQLLNYAEDQGKRQVVLSQLTQQIQEYSGSVTLAISNTGVIQLGN